MTALTAGCEKRVAFAGCGMGCEDEPSAECRVYVCLLLPPLKEAVVVRVMDGLEFRSGLGGLKDIPANERRERTDDLRDGLRVSGGLAAA